MNEAHGHLVAVDTGGGAQDEVVQGIDGAKARDEQGAHKDADEQRAIGFLGDEGQHDSHDGWHE